MILLNSLVQPLHCSAGDTECLCVDSRPHRLLLGRCTFPDVAMLACHRFGAADYLVQCHQRMS